ncbi:hypothetical protein WDU94_002390 [Cyamophila willieti]
MTLPDQINLEEYVTELESEFATRYTDEDPDYVRTEISLLGGEYNDPPIIAPWRTWEPRQNNNNNHRNNHATTRGGRYHGNQDQRYQRNHQGNSERYHGNSLDNNRRGGGRHGNEQYRYRPHHGKPYDRPANHHRRNDERYQDRPRFDDRDTRHQNNSNRYDRGRGGGRGREGGGGGGGRYDRRPGERVEVVEERRYGHYHTKPDTKRNVLPDDSEWT